MKHLFLTLLLGFLAISCHRSTDEPTNPPDLLPSATTTGANTIGCLVNGEVMLPYGSNPVGSPIKSCFYQYTNGGYEFGMYFSNNKNSWKAISISTHKLQFVEGNSYLIKKEESSNSVYAYYLINSGGYSTDNNSMGELKITKLDTVHNIISGTFWFNAVDSNGNIAKITDGRFDFIYTP